MKRSEHYRRAEEFLASTNDRDPDDAWMPFLLAAANVHAILAATPLANAVDS